MSFGGLSPTSLDDLDQEKLSRSTGGARTRRWGGGGGGRMESSDFSRTQRNMATTALNPRVANLLKTMQEMDDECQNVNTMGDFQPLEAPKLMTKEGFENTPSSASSAGQGENSSSSIPVQNGMQQVRTMSTNGNRNQVKTNGGGGGNSGGGGSLENVGMAINPEYENNDLRSVYMSDEEMENYYRKFVPNYESQNKQQPQKSQAQLQQQVGATSGAFSFSTPSFVSGKEGEGMRGIRNREGIMNLSSPSAYQNLHQGYENDSLTQKLNYMIHLLEEKQDVRTGTAIEEMILYCFLGIFVIFLVDSFSKVGKYVR